MIDATKLLKDLKVVLRNLEDDIREHAGETPKLEDRLKQDYDAARAAERTGSSFTEWRDDQVTQAAVAWILGCVFVRFIEDNELIPEPWIAGPSDRLAHAKDQHTHYFRQNPRETDREYLFHVFNQVRQLPAMAELFDEKHNPIWFLEPSGDGAEMLLQFFQKIDATQGGLVHDFTDPDWNTRFLGDLYQNLSENARKKYALLQTPEFIEEFILDRTLDPAIDTFGLKEVRLIDPTCGSGHFLLGAFKCILAMWEEQEPGTNRRELVQRTLKAIYGVDLNPFSIAISRFRLLVAALKGAEIRHLKDAPNFHFNLAVGDSLLHGFATQQLLTGGTELEEKIGHVYRAEDAEELWRIFTQRYHAVVGNPPFITVKDKALNRAYRDRYGSCHRKYSLAVPFMERFFTLAVKSAEGCSAGFVGKITANSFMKREFGKKLIEDYIPRWDLTHIIDTSGAYIPGHGTPTVILFGRHQQPSSKTVRTVMGIKGELSTTSTPESGSVWLCILSQIDDPGSSSEYVSVADLSREKLYTHPWTISGGAASSVLDCIASVKVHCLDECTQTIGYSTIIGDDDAYIAEDPSLWSRRGLGEFTKDLAVGDCFRDWTIGQLPTAFYPPSAPDGIASRLDFSRHFWPLREYLRTSLFYAKTKEERGLRWWDYAIIVKDKLFRPDGLIFPFVATHNHYVFERNGCLSNKTAPGIKLSLKQPDNTLYHLMAALNSSLGLFWLQQVCQGKHKDEPGFQRFEYDCTKLKTFPLIKNGRACLAERLDGFGQKLVANRPDSVAFSEKKGPGELQKAGHMTHAILTAMIAFQ